MQDKVEAKVLGKQVSYPQKYAPEILVAVPRSENREQYAIEAASLPFVGFDAWHAYEVSFLAGNGFPLTGVLKLVYPASSEFLVESKSLKLYLNSFNMEVLGTSIDEAKEAFVKAVKTDLQELLKTTVALHFFQENNSVVDDFEGYEVLENSAEALHQKYSDSKENAALLQVDKTESTLQKLSSNLLRSNCKITNQPDWGSVFIHIKSETPPHKMGLLKYIVSFRQENHFHEEVCEMLFKRLYDILAPEELMVSCIYTRRGGIDICPARATHAHLLPQYLQQSNVLTNKLLRQ